jgi:hypothetical protein
MRMPIYESEDEWRVVAVMNLVRIRRSVYEIGFGIAVVAVGFSLSGWWTGAPIVASAFMGIGTLLAHIDAQKAEAALENLFHQAVPRDE